MHDDDREIMRTTANGLAKAVLYVCVTVFGCMWLSNCTLEDETIISCQESCSGTGTYMESVTSTECVCTESIDRNDIWVAPR